MQVGSRHPRSELKMRPVQQLTGIVLMATVMLASALARSAHAGDTPGTIGYKAFAAAQSKTADAPWQVRVTALEAAYTHSISPLQTPEAIETVSTDDLKQVYLVATEMAYFSMDGKYLAPMSRDLAALEQRGAAGPDAYKSMYQIYVQ